MQRTIKRFMKRKHELHKFIYPIVVNTQFYLLGLLQNRLNFITLQNPGQIRVGHFWHRKTENKIKIFKFWIFPHLKKKKKSNF